MTERGGAPDQAREGGGARRAAGAVLAVAVGFALVLGAWAGLRLIAGLGYEPASLTAARSGPGQASISLAVYPDSYPCHGSASGAPGGGADPDWVTFCPTTSLRVPAHSLVTVTIREYDTATPLHNSFFATVRGTVNGSMLLNGRPVRQVSADQVGHTFTIQTPPNTTEPYLFVSVPLVGVSGSAPNAVTIAGHQYPKPNVIRFQFRTGAPGTYIWHCYVPCGAGLGGSQEGFGGPMGTTGYMAGTITVG